MADKIFPVTSPPGEFVLAPSQVEVLELPLVVPRELCVNNGHIIHLTAPQFIC